MANKAIATAPFTPTKYVELTAEEEAARLAESNAEKEKSEDNKHRVKRSIEYLNFGDQLDAIMKQFNYMRLNGTNLVQDLDDVLNHWLSVKANNPERTK